MGTTFGISDFWDRQELIMIGRWYSSEPFTNQSINACPPNDPRNRYTESGANCSYSFRYRELH